MELRKSFSLAPGSLIFRHVRIVLLVIFVFIYFILCLFYFFMLLFFLTSYSIPRNIFQ